MFGSNSLLHGEHTRPIVPATHAVLDYVTVAGFLMLAWRYRRHSKARGLALANAGMVLTASLMTDYPGGASRTLTFAQHGQLDVAQAAMCGLGPLLLGFRDEPEALPFYAQSMLETAVVSATDFDGDSAPRSDDARGRVDRGDTIYRNTPVAAAGE